MLIQSNGYGYGFGAESLPQLLTQAKDFNCNASICYAIGAGNDALFKKLQSSINVLAGVGGFAPIAVDGFIGAGTIAALQALGKIGLANPPTTKEAAAQNAQSLVNALATLAAKSAAATAAIGPMQLPGTSPAAAAALPKPTSKMLWWILGGLAVVGTVGGIGYVVYRRKG